MGSIYTEIQNEVNRAKTLHENKDYKPADWLTALAAELGEVAHEIDTAKESGEPLKPNYRTELIQVATVPVRAVMDYDKTNQM